MEQLKEIKQSLENIEVSSEESIFVLLLISDLLEDVINKENEIIEKRKEVEEILKRPSFEDALGVVLTKLREDENFFNAYVANISMDIYDTFKENQIAFPQLLELSNKAAYNFMKRWIGK